MAVEVSAPPSSMPQLQSFQKAMALPTVEAAVGQVGAIYTKIKGAHSLLDWALSTAEASVQLAAATAAPFVAAPLAAGDAKVAAAIDQLEKKVPLVSEQPQVIVATTKKAVLAKLSPHMNKRKTVYFWLRRWEEAGSIEAHQRQIYQRATTAEQDAAIVAQHTADPFFSTRSSSSNYNVCATKAAAEERVKSLKELSWTKANALLSTAYGQKALHSVDTGATYAMQLLDHYLPHVGPQEETTGEIVAASNDPALHTMQTVGRLSSVAARRVWANLAYRVNELRNSGIELDVRRYVTALLAAVHLANVTNLQHQQSKAQEKPEVPAPSPPPAPIPAPKQPEDSTPTTTKKVKKTPEGKSNHIQE